MTSTPGRARRIVKRSITGVLSMGACVAAGTGMIWWAIEGDGNVHVVEPGVVIRSAEPSAQGLERIVKTYGARSVVNLRGPNAGTPWYDEEVAASRKFDLQRFDIPLSARRELSPAQVDAVLAVVNLAPKPVLVHCSGGSDRTGLNSAAWLFARGAPADVAGRQLALRYGHFRGLAAALSQWITALRRSSREALQAGRTRPTSSRHWENEC